MRPSDNPSALQVQAVLPTDLEAERAVLGGVLLKNEILGRIGERLTENDFFSEVNRILWRGMLRLKGEHSAIDIITLGSSVSKDSKEPLSAYIAALVESVASTANIDYYVEIVRKKANLRRILSDLKEIEKAITGDKPLEEEEIVDLFKKKAQKVDTSEAKEFTKVEAVIDRISLAAQERLIDGKPLIPVIPTGLTDLDDVIGGLQKKNLVLIGARPSMGKTTFALSIAENIADWRNEESRNPVIPVFSLEMSEDMLAFRMVCSELNIPMNTFFRPGGITSDIARRISSIRSRWREKNIFIHDDPGITTSAMKPMIRDLAMKNGGVDCVMIDYLQLIRGRFNQFRTRNDEIGEITKDLKTIANEMDCPVVLLSQLSRNVELRVERRPQMSDLRDSGNIEQDGDLIMFLYREDYYRKNDPSIQNIVEVIVGKQRNGPTGSVNLFFDKQRFRFENLERGRNESNRGF